MMSPSQLSIALLLASMLLGCGRSPQDLGFQDEAQMQAAFEQGYMTRRRMETSRQPVRLPDYSAIERAIPAPLTPEQSAATMVMVIRVGVSPLGMGALSSPDPEMGQR